MKKQTDKRRKGFTLVEVIVTLTILGIIAAIAIPAGIGYMENAQQTARDKVARSVFLAAQKSLSSEFSSGSSRSVSHGKSVNVKLIDPAYQDTEANQANIVYLSINQSSDNKSDNPLYNLLDTYLADGEILDNTVLVEFNKKTGKVYSAFYSEVDASIGYGAGTADYNAYQRSEKDRKDGKMGYWGVDSTGTAEDTEKEDDKDVIQLVDYNVPNSSYAVKDANDGDLTVQGNNINGGNNYGLLTVECQLPDDMMSVKSMKLELKGSETESFEIVNDVDTGLTASGAQLSLSAIESRTTLGAALETPVVIGSGTDQVKIPMYVEQDRKDEKKILVMLLDCQEKGFSILDIHKKLGSGMITADLIVTGTPENKTYVAADSVHALFGSAKSDSKAEAYEISSVRHLNNIRYMPCAKSGQKTDSQIKTYFAQTKNVYMRNYTNNSIFWQTIGAQGYIAGDKEARNTWGKINGVAGIYDGNCKTIYDLTCGGDSAVSASSTSYGMAGLFSCLCGKGTVTRLELDYTSSYEAAYNAASTEEKKQFFVRGKHRVGGIAGENWGTISQCTVQGNFYSEGGEAKVGAFVGKNMCDKDLNTAPGLVTQCVGVGNVYADTLGSGNRNESACAGGIVGDNYGRITYCEVGTATRLVDQTTASVIHITGVPYFGISTGDNLKAFTDNKGEYNDSIELTAQNDVVTIRAARSAGGIAGQIRASEWGAPPVIDHCVNAAKVISSTANDQGNAGGIVGRYYSQFTGTPVKILNSYNAGTVSGYFYVGGIAGNYKDAPKTEPMAVQDKDQYNQISSCYNTGALSTTTEAISTDKCYAIGGIMGQLGPYTVLSDCYNIGSIKKGGKSTKEDGIISAIANTGLAEYKNCAALSEGPKDYSSAVSNNRRYVSREQMKSEKFEGMKSGGAVGAFSYPYPHFNVDENGYCELKEYFHRTPFN